jgi:hypothetical protein
MAILSPAGLLSWTKIKIRMAIPGKTGIHDMSGEVAHAPGMRRINKPSAVSTATK